MRLSAERAAYRSSKPRVSTGNPGERSGEIRGFSFPHPLPRAPALSFVISTGAQRHFHIKCRPYLDARDLESPATATDLQQEQSCTQKNKLGPRACLRSPT